MTKSEKQTLLDRYCSISAQLEYTLGVEKRRPNDYLAKETHKRLDAMYTLLYAICDDFGLTKEFYQYYKENNYYQHWVNAGNYVAGLE